MPKLRPGRPKQGHSASDVRSRHRRTAERPVSTVGIVQTRSGVRARSSDVGLHAVACIGGNRTATAKAGDVVSIGGECADSIGCVIDRRGINDRETARAGIT
jgi:hypothetical protein